MDFDFSKEPGRKLNKIDFEQMPKEVISIIMPYYNDKENIEQTVYSVLNQTFPCYELLIIDDGSKDKGSLNKLNEIEKIDERIKVIHKENAGVSVARDFGVSKSSEESKYIMFLDSDDLLEPTYLECAYWTLETNKDATWTFTDSVGFESDEYTWNKYFSTNKMKKRNDLIITSLIRKKDFLDVGGFGIKEKNVYEDWNLWLKLLAKGKFPVHINFYGTWYRRKSNSELSRARNNNERAMEIIKKTAKTVKKDVEAKQYPLYNYNWEMLPDNIENIELIKRKGNHKTNLLMIIPWMVMGGADKFNIDLINGLDANKFDVTVITTEPAVNIYRQQYKENATVYDLTTFIDQKYWLAFINYIIAKNNINIVLNTNSEIGYAMLPYIKAKNPQIPIIDYVHMEEWYNRNGGYSRDSSAVSTVIDKTFTCNENSTKIFENFFGRKSEDVQTVYIGVDENKFNPENFDSKKIREKYGITKKYVIGFICRISEQKRPFLLLDIAKKLKEQRDDFLILVAGDGNLLAKVKSTSEKYGLSDNIKFIGNISETEKIYPACDMTLNCSIKEGLALTAYESLSMGIPVISSDVGGQKELINNDVGVIIPCMQNEEDIKITKYSEEEINSYVIAINKVIEKLDSYKEKCRKRILDGFTINQMTEKMSNIIESIANNPNQDKIENGKGLSKNIEVTKELITEKLVLLQEKYEWECQEYNQHYGFKTNYKLQLFKEKMWKHPMYRGFIKFLQKIGLMKVIKKKINID